MKYLLESPPEKFNYKIYFGRSIAERKFQAKKGTKGAVYNCGTTACVAGHACILFDLHGDDIHARQRGVFDAAAAHLGLNGQLASFLFLMQAGCANRNAAVARIKWLLRHGTSEGYDLTAEPKTCRYRLPESDRHVDMAVVYRQHKVV
jgi:hypothetical protein